MKIITMIFIFAATHLFAQDALKINYGKQEKYEISEETFTKNPALAEAERKAMEEIRNFEMILYNNQAEYSFVQKIDNQQKEKDGSPRIIVSFGLGDEKQYSDYDTGLHYQTSTFNGKFRIVKSNLPMYDWKLTRETKKILGLEVRKATTQFDNDMIVAWYAPKIAYKAGPEDVWGLPGLILEYEITSLNEEHPYTMHVFAQELTYLENAKVKINFPDDSASISKEEHHAQIIKESERRKEMYSQGVDTSD